MDLGVQTSAARRRVSTARRLRINKVKKCVLKLGPPVRGKRSLAKVLKTGAWPAASYGRHMAQGVSPAQVARTREVFASGSALPGVDICARTALAITLGEGEDPSIKAVIDQIEFWIDFWLNHTHLQERIRRYWGLTFLNLMRDPDRWKHGSP